MRKPAPIHAGILGALAVVTSASNALAFRTAGDLEQFSGTERVRWAAGAIPWVLHEALPGDLFQAEVESTLIRAFDTWRHAECGVPFAIYEGTTLSDALPGDGINTVQWITAGWESLGFNPEAGALSDVQYETDADGKWRIVEADLYLNAERFQWLLEGSLGEATRDVRSVLIHEVGHIMGLLHNCEEDGAGGAPACGSDRSLARAMMYPVYDANRLTLSADDLAAACFLYEDERCEPACSAGEVCAEGACRVPCAGALCAVGEVCEERRCVRPLPPCTAPECEATLALAGDPCEENGECASAVCAGGYCARPCTSDGDCLNDQHCDAGAEVCVGPGQAIGATCQTSDQCLGGECVAGAESHALCTRKCDDDSRACPAGWDCAAADGTHVCIPQSVSAEGGACNVAGEARGSTGAAYLLVAFGGCIAGSARRFRRRRVPASQAIGSREHVTVE